VEDFKHAELTRKIIGCAMKVHSFFGSGFQEVIYQKALALEFFKGWIEFSKRVRSADLL